jgi:hypothetical protein
VRCLALRRCARGHSPYDPWAIPGVGRHTVNGQRGKMGLLPATSATTSHGMSLFPDQPPPSPPPEKPKQSAGERRLRYEDRLKTIRLRMLIFRELEDRDITTPAEIGAALGMLPAEATKLLRGHQWREGDVTLLQAAAARLEVPGAQAGSDRQ